MTKVSVPSGAAASTTWKDAPTRTLDAGGDNDVMVASRHSHDLARRIPGAKLVIHPDSRDGGVFQYHRELVPAVLDVLESPA